MGHFYEFHEGTGKNRREAWADCVHQFYYENGHNCSIRSDHLGEYDDPPDPPGTDEEESDRCYGILVEQVPPLRWVEVEQESFTTRYNHYFGAMQRVPVKTKVNIQQRDASAPASEWLERWRFRIHYHH